MASLKPAVVTSVSPKPSFIGSKLGEQVSPWRSKLTQLAHWLPCSKCASTYTIYVQNRKHSPDIAEIFNILNGLVCLVQRNTFFIFKDQFFPAGVSLTGVSRFLEYAKKEQKCFIKLFLKMSICCFGFI